MLFRHALNNRTSSHPKIGSGPKRRSWLSWLMRPGRRPRLHRKTYGHLTVQPLKMPQHMVPFTTTSFTSADSESWAL